jgi:predicted secreted protein
LRVAAILILFCLTSCGGPDASPQNGQGQFVSANIYVTEAHDGSVVALRPGQSFEVRLQENMTTDPPVQWAMSTAPPHLRLLGTAVTPTPSGAPGSAVTRTFRFGAIAEGEGSLVVEARQASRRVSFRVDAASDMVID